ncbi:Thiamine-phosphate pyrophosphorylase, partial [Globisporangium splendens]
MRRTGNLLPLYFITPSVGAKLSPARLPRVVEDAIRGGADIVQWRQKPASADLAAIPDLRTAWDNSKKSSFFLLETAKEIRNITRKYGVPLIVNDSLELALEIEADGVHVGQTDAKIADLQQRLRVEGKQELIVGVTVRDSKQAKAACEGGATYLGAGPVFKSSSKPNANDGHTIGIEGLRECTNMAQKYDVPVYAIGGLSLADASIQSCISEGKAAGVSVIAAIGNAEDVEAAAAAIRKALIEATET